MATKKGWMYVPPKPAKLNVPKFEKAAVKCKADEFVESFLKPTFIKEPPKDYQWNYVVDIFTKWYQWYFYFCSTWRSPSPNAISERLELWAGRGNSVPMSLSFSSQSLSSQSFN